MPFIKFTPAPGVNVQRTPLLNKQGWSDSNLIRFREGMPEVKGGWSAFLPGGTALQGVPRQLHAWQSLNGTPILAAGTNERLYVCEGGTPFDITPIALTTTPTNPFTTIAGESIVTVVDPDSDQQPGNFVEISGATAVAGISLSGEYQVVTRIDANTYTIDASPQIASGAATGGGTPTMVYLLPIGPVDAIANVGYGAGPYGAETYGTPRTIPTGLSASAVLLPRLWTLANWGEDLLANPRGYGIYQWSPSTGTSTRASLLSGAPAVANGLTVSTPLQMAIAWGTAPAEGGAQDPMLISWSDVGDNTDWLPTTTNQAGSFRLSTGGSSIQQVLVTQQQQLVWTDIAIYGMQYLGPPLVWGFVQLGVSCGAISPNAAAIFGGIAYWWSTEEFWYYDGAIHPLDSPWRDRVFANLNVTQQSKVFCALGTQHGEITWYYPSKNSQEIDSYVTVNVIEQATSGPMNAWYGGMLQRTAWIDDNIFGDPISADATGMIYNEEQLDYTANGGVMPWMIKSGMFDLGEGEMYSFVDLMIPDLLMSGGPVNYTFYVQNYSADMPVVYGPYQVARHTRFLPLRFRGRQLQVQIDNINGLPGVFWRNGATRFRIAADGRL